MENKKILEELEARAVQLTEERASGNTSVTIIRTSSSDGVKDFVERGFSGCGSVNWTLEKSDWRLAKSLGFKKGYRNYYWGGSYYNGQFGDACWAYNAALSEKMQKYPGSILEKIGLQTNID